MNHILPKTRQLIQATAGVKYEILESELEALLIEAELVRLHQPHYNILLKDDKSPLYIITTKEPYPRVLAARKSDIEANLYPVKRQFGPFPSARQVREVLKITRRIFPYCTAPESDKKRRKACFYRHLNQCPGACTGEIGVEEYGLSIRNLELFLRGKYRQVVRDLTTGVKAAVKTLDYETAGKLKQKIDAITSIVAHYRLQTGDQILPDLTENHAAQKVFELKRLLHAKGLKVGQLSRIEGYDVANLHGQSAAVSMVVATDGEPDHPAYRHFAVKTLHTPNDVGMLKEAMVRRQYHPEWGIPDLILIDGGKPQLKAVMDVLVWHIPVIGLAKNPDRLMIVKRGIKPVFHTVKIVPGTPAGSLLLAIRNEAHRFSRRLHHLRSEKRLLGTS